MQISTLDAVDPEIINSYELGVSYDLLDTWTLRGNYFYALIEDLLDTVEDPTTTTGYAFKNVGGLSRGFVVELTEAFRMGYVWANYSHINADMDTGEPMPNIADHLASAGVNLGLGKYLNLNLWGYYRGERPIAKSPLKTDSYTNINLNLRITDILPNLEGYLTVYNLFDKEYAYPGIYGFTVPARGREAMLGVRYTF